MIHDARLDAKTSPPAIVVSAPESGSGKTTVVTGLLRSLKRQGIKVRSAKTGPDFIDPIYHSAASGQPSVTLDTWGLRPSTVRERLARTSEADLLLVEGGMGLFDGGLSGIGSTASLAALTRWPVILVIDASRQGQSVGAVIQGFQRWRDGVAIRGCILNRVASPRHEKLLLEAIEELDIEILGLLPRRESLRCPSRRLGLTLPPDERILEEAAAVVETHIALDKLLSIAETGSFPNGKNGIALNPLGQRIAVASDECFRFTYSDTLYDWRASGAEIAFFSPLADEGPSLGCDAVFLPGGYPELYPRTLSENRRFLSRLRQMAAQGCTIYGECGGYMVLGSEFEDRDGVRYPMAGLLPIHTSFLHPRLNLGYRRVQGLEDGFLGPKSTVFRGHEFHYAGEQGSPAPLFQAYDLTQNVWTQVGCRVGSVAGSFIHLMDREEDCA